MVWGCNLESFLVHVFEFAESIMRGLFRGTSHVHTFSNTYGRWYNMRAHIVSHILPRNMLAFGVAKFQPISCECEQAQCSPKATISLVYFICESNRNVIQTHLDLKNAYLSQFEATGQLFIGHQNRMVGRCKGRGHNTT